MRRHEEKGKGVVTMPYLLEKYESHRLTQDVG